MTEQWRPIPGYENHYEVSDTGRVRSVKGDVPKPLKGMLHAKQGHRFYSLWRENVQLSYTAARLVCMAFHGAPDGRRSYHLNGDVTDDRVTNVGWGDA